MEVASAENLAACFLGLLRMKAFALYASLSTRKTTTVPHYFIREGLKGILLLLVSLGPLLPHFTTPFPAWGENVAPWAAVCLKGIVRNVLLKHRLSDSVKP